MRLTVQDWAMFIALAVAAIVIVHVGGEPAPKETHWIYGGKNSDEGVVVIHADRN